MATFTGVVVSRLPRGRRARRVLRENARAASRSALGAARVAPMPPALRRGLQRHLLWPGTTRAVPVDRILLGSQNGLPAAAWARATGDLLWPSRPVAEGPHADLLRLGLEGPPTGGQLLNSSYAAMARTCIRLTGDFFGATDDAGIVDVARARLARDRGMPEPWGVLRRSEPGRPVLLAPIRDSDCYQVVDGHHRVAALVVAGEPLVHALVRRVPESTPLQDLLDRMSWIGGEAELYQPVSSPELERSWRTVRRCTDRLESMRKVVEHLGIDAGASRYLDVASCYGWFVARMEELGFAAEGVERDPLGGELGRHVYGLAPGRIAVDDAVEFLRRAEPRGWEVVSCFSLLHHFALGRASTDAAELVRLLDRATGRVLFLDTGQSHERWFADRLPEWTAAYVAEFLREHGTFDEVVDLGPDGDAVPPYEDNYGRHLFAAIRY